MAFNSCRSMSHPRGTSEYYRPMAFPRGKHHTEETKAKMRRAMKGRTLTPAHKRKIGRGVMRYHLEQKNAPAGEAGAETTDLNGNSSGP